MAFESFADFLAMGKHGFYVWLVYGTSVTVLVGTVIAAHAHSRRVWRELQEAGEEEMD